MNRRLHTRLSILLPALVAVLLLGTLTVAVGVTFGRYLTDGGWDFSVTADQNGAVCLGYIREGAFVPEEAAWVTAGDKMQLDFAVSNGTGEAAFSPLDQQVRVQVLASLGAWDSDMTLILTVGEETYTAASVAIPAGSATHAAFGDGYALTFTDDGGRELIWSLSGDAWQVKTMRLTLTGVEDTGLVQLRVIGETL